MSLKDRFPIQHKKPNTQHLYLEFVHPDIGTFVITETDITDVPEYILKARLLSLKQCLKRHDIFEIYDSYPKWLFLKDVSYEVMYQFIKNVYSLKNWKDINIEANIEMLFLEFDHNHLLIEWPFDLKLFILNDIVTTKVFPTGKEEIFKIKLI